MKLARTNYNSAIGLQGALEDVKWGIFDKQRYAQCLDILRCDDPCTCSHINSCEDCSMAYINWIKEGKPFSIYKVNYEVNS